MANSLTDRALNLIKGFEGLRLVAYRDIAGIWTIGYGHTGEDVTRGETISEGEANAMLAYDLGRFINFVAGCIIEAPATTDSQFSAMVSLCYNIGEGAFKHSTVLREHLAGRYPQAAHAFLLWDKSHVDGQLVVVAGLLRRRQVEAELYVTDDL